MDKVASVVTLRAHRVSPPPGDRPRERFVRELETDAAALGWVLSPDLREAVSRVPKKLSVSWGDWLLATLQADVGGDLPWVPLFRRFPHSTPKNTDRLYIQRMIAATFQDDGPDCVLCGGQDTVRPVSPCGHLVCRACFSSAEYTACPICHRRLDPTDPFLTLPTASEQAAGPPVRLRRLDVGRGAEIDAAGLRDDLATRLAPLSVAERDDLLVLIRATTAPGDLSWLGDVPARETKAVITAEALRVSDPGDRRTVIATVRDRWDTATDVARTLWAFSDGDPGLHVPRREEQGQSWLERWRPFGEPKQTVAIPRVAPLPRPWRTAILERLDGMAMPTLVEDVLRHRTVWKRIAERLHPFEYSARFPKASAAFSVLRESWHPRESAPGKALLTAHEEGWVRLLERDDLVSGRPRTLRALVENALDDGDAGAVLDLLSDRPGDLIRRLDHVARLWDGDPSPLADAARAAALTASPRLVMSAMASVSQRDRAIVRESAVTEHASREAKAGQRAGAESEHPRVGARAAADEVASRVFFPRNGAANLWSGPDERKLLAEGLPAMLANAMSESLARRAARLSRFDIAVVDVDLKDVPIPAGTQTASDSSASLPRGARVVPLTAETLRLFLHWIDPDKVRVDLDLSVMLFDENWRRLDHCDYTQLRSTLGAVHSGDLTSAPGPLGATEFLDLDLATLRSHAVAWLVPVVFSYNDVPFENLTESIAGIGVPFPGQHFDPAGVLVRYDLTGNSRASLPFTLNLIDGSMRWLDLHLPSHGYAHSVGTRGDRLGELVADLESLYSGPTRADSFTLAMTHARARADAVLLRDGETYTDLDGRVVPAPDLGGQRVLAVCRQDPPELAGLAEGSLVVTVAAESSGTEDLNYLLSTLAADDASEGGGAVGST